jgi:hypothetical protein
LVERLTAECRVDGRGTRPRPPPDERRSPRPEGVIRIVGAGLIALVFGGFSYSKRRETVAIGPLQASIREQERVSVPPILGAIAVIAGVGLIVLSSKKRKGK